MRAAALLVVGALLLAGCLGGGGTDQVSNLQDNFRYTARFSGKGGTEGFDWENTRGQANVRMPATLSQGTVSVTVLDGARTSVFEGTLSAAAPGRELAGPTSPGSPGIWRVELRFDGFTGNFSLSVRATAP